jgi:hypothetical protein
MEGMTIKLEDGKWFLNDKPFEDLSPNERQCMDNFFSNLKNSLEKANERLKNLKSHNHKFQCC